MGDASYTSQSLSLTNLSAAGEISFEVDDDVIIENDQSTVIEGSATNLTVSALVGSITDSGDLEVDAVADFTAMGTDGRITLNNTGNTFGSIAASTIGVATIVESDDTRIDALSVSSLVLSSGGNVTDGANASISVSSSAEINANGDIALGDEAGDVISLSVLEASASDIVIDEDSADGFSVSDISADSIELSSASSLSSTINSNITVAGAASLTANNGLGEIDFSNSSNAFGSLSVIGSNISITERDSSQLSQVTANGDFTIDSAQGISDSVSSFIQVTGVADLEATGDITLGTNGNTVNFGTVSLSGNNIDIVESSSANITNVDTSMVSYSANGEILVSGVLDADDAVELVADEGDANITATNSLNEFSQLLVNGADVQITNTGATELVEVDVTNLTLTSGGAVTDGDGDSISVTELATISAGGSNITLGDPASAADNDSVQFGSVALEGGNVSVTQTNDINVVSLDIGGDLTLTSLGGDINTLAGASISADGVGATDVTLTVSRNTGVVNFVSDGSLGNLNVTAFAANISEVGDASLEMIDVNDFTLSSTASITETSGAVTNVSGLASLTAANSISLGAIGTANFGSLNLSAIDADIAESSATVLNTITLTNDFDLTSIGAVSQSVGSSVQVGGLATIVVPEGAIDLNANLGSIDLSAAEIDLVLNSDTTAIGVIADNFNLSSEGNRFTIGQAGSVRVDSTASITSQDVIFDAGSQNEFGSLRVTTSNSGSISILSDISSRVVQGVPTNNEGTFEFFSPNITLGMDATEVAITTTGSISGGAITFSGVDAANNPVASLGVLQLAGDTSIDTTNGGLTDGAVINLLADSVGVGSIGAQDITATTLTLSAGIGDIALGNFVDDSQINTLTITSGNNLTINDLYVAGNTVDVNVSGEIVANGTIQDTVGSVSLVTTGGSIGLNGQVASNGLLNLSAESGSVTTQNITAGNGLGVSALNDVQFLGDVAISGGEVSVVSSAGSITTGNVVDQTGGAFSSTGAGNVSLQSNGTLLLGGAMTSAGQVSLSSQVGSVTANDSISAGTGLNIVALQDVSLNQVDVTAGDMAIVVEQGLLKFNNNVTTSGDFTAFSLLGGFEQEKDTLISSGGNLTVSTQQGMLISSLRGDTGVSLSIRETDTTLGENTPSFLRVNDPIIIGDNTAIPDVQSGDTIAYLSQVASVGSADAAQNFVQRADGGIFYGLVAGQFFSDDIGSSPLLAVSPANAQAGLDSLFDATSPIAGLASAIFTNDFASISAQVTSALSGSDSASGNAGQTSAASSSRSTAASQRDDEDEVAEVDEAAFQNLKNYDENPQGILLPEDQQFAYDEDGNMYYMVTLRRDSGAVETFPLYRIDLSLSSGRTLSSATFSTNYTPLAVNVDLTSPVVDADA